MDRKNHPQNLDLKLGNLKLKPFTLNRGTLNPKSREDVKLALPELAAGNSILACGMRLEWAPKEGLPNWVLGAALGCRN